MTQRTLRACRLSFMCKVALAAGILVTTHVAAVGQIKKCVFVIVDGIPADVIEKLRTPALDAIARAGGYTWAYVGGGSGTYSETPTISAVGYNSLLTGTWVNKHNVWDNDILAPNYQYWTIFRFFKEQYPQKKAAVFSTWRDNRTKLIGDGLAATGNLKVDYYFDGLESDTVRFPHDNQSEYIHRIDETVVTHAAEYIVKNAPDLSWVYLQYTDDMGHRFGDSDAFYRSVELMDDQIGRLWNALQYREKNFNEAWEIFVTTDHGRDAATGKSHGGQSVRERNTWIATNAKNLNTYFRKGHPAIVDIMPTIARFMDVALPRNRAMELDGVPLAGPVSISNPAAMLPDNKLHLAWKAWNKKGDLKIWITTTNRFKEGGEDAYRLLATVPVRSQKATLDLKEFPSQFYKIVLEAPDNTVNVWAMKPGSGKSEQQNDL